jgi:hypothetical protein
MVNHHFALTTALASVEELSARFEVSASTIRDLESFWSTLKTEFYDRRRWATRHAAVPGYGPLDRGVLQPCPAALSPGLQHTRGTRTISRHNKTSAGTSRLINWPRFAGNPITPGPSFGWTQKTIESECK